MEAAARWEQEEAGASWAGVRGGVEFDRAHPEGDVPCVVETEEVHHQGPSCPE